MLQGLETPNPNHVYKTLNLECTTLVTNPQLPKRSKPTRLTPGSPGRTPEGGGHPSPWQITQPFGVFNGNLEVRVQLGSQGAGFNRALGSGPGPRVLGLSSEWRCPKAVNPKPPPKKKKQLALRQLVFWLSGSDSTRKWQVL